MGAASRGARARCGGRRYIGRLRFGETAGAVHVECGDRGDRANEPCLPCRFAIQYNDQNGQQRNAYGNFSWQETGDTVTLQLRNPLGQTLAIVTSSPASATLELPNRQPLTADNVSTLMQNALGFALPVEGLRYWLQPSPAPTSRAKTEKDPEQPSRFKEITQDGWTIDYLAYAEAPATGVKRVNLTRSEPPLDIKLVLDQ